MFFVVGFLVEVRSADSERKVLANVQLEILFARETINNPFLSPFLSHFESLGVNLGWDPGSHF